MVLEEDVDVGLSLRYPVEDVLGWMGAGVTADEILADYPDLEREELQAALLHAARLARIEHISRTA